MEYDFVCKMSKERTVNALLGRGVPLKLAERLASDGYTLARIKRMEPESLRAAGIPSDVVRSLADRRPPIPFKTLYKLLWESKRICCVCREPAKSIVVHHIIPWSRSRGHNEQDLAVVCTDCHSEAHTTRQLARNLTPDELRHHKTAWLAEVKQTDTRNLLSPNPELTPLEVGATWDYFNTGRLVEVAHTVGVDFSRIESFAKLRRAETLDGSGRLNWSQSAYQQRDKSSYLYDGVIPDANVIYKYFGELLVEIVSRSSWVDLRQIWSRSRIEAIVQSGAVVALTAAFRYKNLDPTREFGPKQKRLGYYQKKGIRLQFHFDAWETTSSSASMNLSGIWRSTCICIMRSLNHLESELRLGATCLGIGTGFSDYRGTPPRVALQREEVEEHENEEEDDEIFG